jgi:hypothetical protein
MSRVGGALATLLAAAALAAAADVPAGTSGWLWSSPRPQGTALRDVGLAGATGYAVGTRGTILKSTDGGEQWATVPYPGALSLGLVDVVDASTVVALSECAVIRSAGPRGPWRGRHLRIAADGTFSGRWKLGRGTTTFVASTLPGTTSIGAGSRALTVTVRTPHRPH